MKRVKVRRPTVSFSGRTDSKNHDIWFGFCVVLYGSALNPSRVCHSVIHVILEYWSLKDSVLYRCLCAVLQAFTDGHPTTNDCIKSACENKGNGTHKKLKK